MDLVIQGGGGQYPFPKEVWTPSGELYESVFIADFLGTEFDVFR